LVFYVLVTGEDAVQGFAIWLTIGIGLLVLEMATGTLYLLFIGLSAILGALAAYAGVSMGWQVAVFAAPAVVSCIWGVPLTRRRRKAAAASLDIGQTVRFERWTSRETGLARVNYRGSQWDADVLGEVAGSEGEVLYIVATDGNRLKVAGTAAGEKANDS
jgi:membrane protein implicated in regulation of membrane protease activity